MLCISCNSAAMPLSSAAILVSIVTLYVIVFSLALCVYRARSKNCRHRRIHDLYQFIFIAPIKNLRYYIGPERWDSMNKKCFNFVDLYLIAFSYVIVVVLIFFAFILYVGPMLPIRQTYTALAVITSPHVIYLYVLMSLVSWVLINRGDPGIITQSNYLDYTACFKYDDLLFTESPPRNCPTCKIPKVARSKHCRSCDRCVARFDHHCALLGNCVGMHNFRYFQIFLWYHTFQAMHISLMCFAVCYNSVYRLGLLKSSPVRSPYYYQFKDNMGSYTLFLLKIIIYTQGVAWILGLSMGIVAIALIVFESYYIRLTLRNTTSNEMNKAQKLHFFIKSALNQIELYNTRDIIEKHSLYLDMLEEIPLPGQKYQTRLESIKRYDEVEQEQRHQVRNQLLHNCDSDVVAKVNEERQGLVKKEPRKETEIESQTKTKTATQNKIKPENDNNTTKSVIADNRSDISKRDAQNEVDLIVDVYSMVLRDLELNASYKDTVWRNVFAVFFSRSFLKNQVEEFRSRAKDSGVRKKKREKIA